MTSNYSGDFLFTAPTREIIKEIAKIYSLDLEWKWTQTCLAACSLNLFIDYVDWADVSCHHYLTEEFIRFFSDKVCWENIDYHQKLSKEFKSEFKDRFMAQDYKLTQNDFPIGSIVKGKDAAALLHAKIFSYIDNETVEVEWIATGHITSLNINSLEMVSRGDFPLGSKVAYYNKMFNRIIYGTVQSYHSGVFTDQIAIKVSRTDGNTFYVKPSELKLVNPNPYKEISLPEIYSFSQDINTLKLPNDNTMYNKTLSDEIFKVAIRHGIATEDLSVYEVINNLRDHANWNLISEFFYYPLSEDFIREFKDKVDWDSVSSQKSVPLSEDFIREFQHLVTWTRISYDQKLSESFIREFKDKVYWNNISIKQTMSKEFLLEFEDSINWELLYQNPNISEDIKNSLKRKVLDSGYEKAQEEIMNQVDIQAFSPVSKLEIKSSTESSSPYPDKFANILLHPKHMREFYNAFGIKYNIDIKYKDPETKLLTDETIQEIKNKVDWSYISKSTKVPVQKLPVSFLRTFQDKIDWGFIFIHDTLSEAFIREFQDTVHWANISCNQKLSESFIREMEDKVDWSSISSFQKLSEDFIREFKNKVNWDYISKYQVLSEDFIREFKDKVDWDSVSSQKSIPLSEDFIREFQHLVTWTRISYDQKLSESFIREFKDKVYWNNISIKQTMSKEFLLEFEDSINWDLLYQNSNISDDIKNSLKRKVLDSGYEKAHKEIMNQVDVQVFEGLEHDYDFPPVTKLKIKEEKNMKEQLLDGVKELGKSCAHGVELAAVGSGQEAAYNAVVRKLGISKELSNDPAFKAAVKLIIPALLYLGSVAFEGKIPHLEYLKPILKMSVEETTRENTQLIVDLVSEVGMAMYQSYMKPELPTKNVKFRIATTDYDSIKVPKLRSLAKEKGLTGYSGLKREELINLLHQTDEEESPKIMTN